MSEDGLFTREITVGVKEGSDNTLVLHGRLSDTRLGEPLHVMEVEMQVAAWDGEIRSVEGRLLTYPLSECREGLASLQELVGVMIRPGFTDLVKSTVGSNRGCSHLAALVMNMGNTSVQGRGAFLRKNFPDDRLRDEAMKHNARELGLIDSCVAWRTDGPIIRRWLEEHPEDRPRY